MRKLFSKFLAGLLVVLCLFTVGGCTAKGAFYTLEEAYEREWITVDDLMEIAEYYNSGTECTDSLSSKTQKQIKQTYLEKELDMPFPFATTKNIEIKRYYGTYEGSVVVEVFDDIINYDLAFEDKEIGGVSFDYYCARKIWVWKV